MNVRSSLTSFFSLCLVGCSVVGLTGCAAGGMNDSIVAMPAYPEISAAEGLSRVQHLSTPKPLKRLLPSRPTAGRGGL